MQMHLELTDTFGGEANYSYVHRETLEIKPDASDLSIVRKAKKWAGFTGLPCRISHYGDMIEIRPRSICQVIFITFA